MPVGVTGSVTDIEDIREHLKQWGRWLHESQSHCARSVIGQYQERIGDKSAGLVLMPDNEIAERIERILCRVKAQNPQVFRVLWWWYYVGASVPEISIKTRVSESTVKSRRLMGETSVVSYWDAGYGKIKEKA